jgi:hypothetical protein
MHTVAIDRSHDKKRINTSVMVANHRGAPQHRDRRVFWSNSAQNLPKLTSPSPNRISLWRRLS